MFGKVTKFHSSALVEVEIIASELPTTMPTVSDGIENLGDGYTLAPGSTMIVTGTDKRYILGDDGTWEELPAGGGDVSGKADKVSGAVSGNFAGLDGNGNLTDSGKKASDFVTRDYFLSLLPPEQHRMIFRGKNLGQAVSAEQLAAIRNGSFDDLFIGDYWENTVTIDATIDGAAVNNTFTEKWRIADINYWLHCNNNNSATSDFTTPHLVIVPDTSLYDAKMNDTATTEGGYLLSKMRNTSTNEQYAGNLQYALTAISTAFPDIILNRVEYLTNEVTNGRPTGAAWRGSTIELMNENMVYGHGEFTPANNGADNTLARNTIDKTQLALFQIVPAFIIANNTVKSQWLRDVSSSNSFCAIDHRGYSRTWQALNSFGVRPVFAIG